MTQAGINVATVVVEHQDHRGGCGWPFGPDHCLPYRLAAKVADAWDEGAACRRMEDGSDEPADDNPYRTDA